MASVRKSRTAMDMLKCNDSYISTYSKKFDEMLGMKKNVFYSKQKIVLILIDGGIPMGVITELCGNPGSGKSNLWFV